MSSRLGLAASAGVVLVALLGAAALAGPAVASEGSVPPEVAEFAADPDGLVASLEEFFGPGADGEGIRFDESTEIGAVHRVFTFSPDWLACRETYAPVGLANEWVVPVSVDGGHLGVAVIWINPGTVRPQLADFTEDAGFADALALVADDSYVVSDEARGAWFELAQSGITPLLAGGSGVDGQIPLAQYRAVAAQPEEAPVEEAPSLGAALPVGAIAVVALVVVLVVLVPLVRRRRAGDERDDERDDEPEPEGDAGEDEPEPDKPEPDKP
ncbi:hypothetical protein BH09ACT5_BH09ACT5_14770 [soil metagenome]